MKTYTAIISLLVASTAFLCAAPSFGTAWDDANTAYVNGDYGKAIIIYDSIVDAGYGSDKLYYNLANAWFKQGRIGKSILNYNRAQRLNPSDSDIRHNLRVANTYVKDKIETLPEFFLFSWTRSLRQSMGSNSWAVLSLVFIALALGAVLLYLLSGNLRLRKTGFYTAIVALAIGLASVCFSIGQKNLLADKSEAIVMSTAAPVKSSPDNSSKDIFILHEGTMVRIVSRLNQWVEITIADGNKGWIHENMIEVI